MGCFQNKHYIRTLHTQFRFIFMKNTTVKPYTPNELREFLNLPENAESPTLDDKQKAMLAFVEKFQTIENTFSFIIDFTTMEYLFVSESIYHVTGYERGKWIKGGVEFAMSLYHPDDEQAARQIHQRKIDHTYSLPIEEREDYRLTHDFRIRHADGHYIRINHHAIYLQFDDLGHPLSTLCISNDITKLKRSTTLQLEIAKLDNTGAYKVIDSEYFPLSDALDISSREYEVLALLAEGFDNKQIANKLCISEHTVRYHRKNMLAKNDIGSISNLISLAWKHELF